LKTRGEAAVTKIAGLSDTGDTPGVYAACLNLKGKHMEDTLCKEQAVTSADNNGWQDWLRLSLTPQIGLQTQHRLVTVFGSPAAVFTQSAAALLAQLSEAQAKALQDAGAQLLVLECIPTALAKRITEVLTIPVIGIGAGNVTDGQVLVMHDLLGISSGYIPKFSKNYLAQTGEIRSAIAAYVSEVKSQTFPASEHSY
jgi:hypothetical protein